MIEIKVYSKKFLGYEVNSGKYLTIRTKKYDVSFIEKYNCASVPQIGTILKFPGHIQKYVVKEVVLSTASKNSAFQDDQHAVVAVEPLPNFTEESLGEIIIRDVDPVITDLI